MSLAAAHEALAKKLSDYPDSTLRLSDDPKHARGLKGEYILHVTGFVIVTEAEARAFTVPTVQGV